MGSISRKTRKFRYLISKWAIMKRNDDTGVSPFGVRGSFAPNPTECYARLYCTESIRLQMAALPFRALQLWTWIMYEITEGDDFVRIDVERMMSECGIISKRTLKVAVDELRRAGYIAPCVGHKNVYWINPSIGFKGSRVKAFPSCVVKRGNYE